MVIFDSDATSAAGITHAKKQAQRDAFHLPGLVFLRVADVRIFYFMRAGQLNSGEARIRRNSGIDYFAQFR